MSLNRASFATLTGSYFPNSGFDTTLVLWLTHRFFDDMTWRANTSVHSAVRLMNDFLETIALCIFQSMIPINLYCAS
jgi:hypothetical protein